MATEDVELNDTQTLDAGLSESSIISRVPPEVLIEIFLEALAKSHSRRSDFTLTLLLVSKRWRRIIIGTPDIWATIYSSNPVEIQASMTYAGSVPLTIQAEHLLPNKDEPLTTIFGAFSRVHSLTLCAHREDTKIGGFEEMWTSPAPQLEEILTTGIVLPRSLFAGSAPRLRTFSLYLGSGDWNTFPVCPQLESLEIIAPDTIISITTLLNKLRRMSRLTKLVIEKALDNSNPPGGRIELPKLQELCLIDDHTECTIMLLNHLTIPADTRLELSMDCEEEMTPSIATIEALRRCRKDASWDLQSLSVVTNEREPTSLVMTFPAEGNISGEDKPHEIIFDAIPHPFIGVKDIFQHLGLSYLRSLDLDGAAVGYHELSFRRSMSPMGQSFWTFVATLPYLESLSVRNIFALDFVAYWIYDEAFSDGTKKPFESLLHLVYDESYQDIAPDLNGLVVTVEYLTHYGPHLAGLTVISAVALEEHTVEGLKALPVQTVQVVIRTQ
ncbi:hypothetical protein BDN72DRAFT_963418 [Pluteus cervinus]|uniref:Uncharacterized protein n=1 Tax=Pluteus cervinus TaxID=181527 RepID=A0ACD3AE19_9AGAR|nr:hypothetical protein BDN72DRAFT_963418 [Pluteus cervinus]